VFMIRMAMRNFRFRWKRYAFLGSALSFCIAMILVLTGLSGGATWNVNDAATLYYGGDLFILGHQKTPHYTPIVRDRDSLFAALKDSGIRPRLVVRRTNYFENGILFFGGESIRQKRVTGVDWNAESRTFSAMDFVSGSAGGLAGTDGIIISRAAADTLGAKVGDDLLLLVDTVTGQRNTATLIVKGIFRDSGIFGYYTSYMDIEVLNRLIGIQDDECTTLGIYLRDRWFAVRAAKILHDKLSERVPTFAPVSTQPELWSRLAEDWVGVKYAVLTLDGYLDDVRDLIGALNAGTWFLLCLMLAVIVIGISNTYRVIVYDRFREIGTMRALGMQRSATGYLILCEALLLSVASVVVGSALGFLALSAISLVPVPRIPGIELFLASGKLSWSVRGSTMALDFSIVCLATLLGVWKPSRIAAGLAPAEALRAE
jgi:putative ABC transport system permease protein